MNFIYEKDVALAEIRERSDKVAGFFERGAGGASNVDAEFSGNELSESRLAESGRTEEKRMIQRFSARESGIDVDAQ